MALDREAPAAALFTKLAAIPGLRTASRKFQPLSQLQPSDLPALFLTSGPQSPKQRRGLPTVWTLGFTVFIYCENDAPEGPATELNRLIQEVEACLERSPEELKALEQDRRIPDALYQDIVENTQGTTLGGLCSHCWIAGTIETDEGILMNQAAAAIPIEALTL